MVAWVVIFRPQPRLATLLRHVTKYRSPQVLVDSALTNRDARNSFRIRSYENCRVSPDQPNIPLSKPANALFIYPLSFQTLACSPTQRRALITFVFKFLRTLSIATEGVPSIHILLSVGNLRPHFLSPHPRFLVTYLVPILPT